MKFNLVVLALSTAENEHSFPAHLPLPPHLRSLPANIPIPPHLRQKFEDAEITTGEATTTGVLTTTENHTTSDLTTTSELTTTEQVTITEGVEATPKPPSLLAALLGDYEDQREPIEPSRGSFDLQAALRFSRERGYGKSRTKHYCFGGQL